MCTWVYWPGRPEEGSEVPGADVTGSCNPPNMEAEQKLGCSGRTYVFKPWVISPVLNIGLLMLIVRLWRRQSWALHGCRNWEAGKLNNLSKGIQVGSDVTGLHTAFGLGEVVSVGEPRVSTVISLSRHCGLDPSLPTSSLTGFMVSNQCHYYKAISFPQIPVAALAVEKVGRSSVYYRLAVFPPKSTEEMPSVDHYDLTDGFFFGHPKLAQFDPLACATGSAVHVFVNPATGKPENLPEDFRNNLQKLMRPA